MKIIYFIPKPFSLIFGGGEVQLLKTKEALLNLGVDIEFVDFFKHDQINKNTTVHFFGCDYIFGQIGAMLKGRGIPYVVSSIYYPIGLTRLIHKWASKIPFSQINLKKHLLENAKFILPNSLDEKRLLVELYKIDPEKIKIIPNGIDPLFVGNDPEAFYKLYLPEIPKNESFVLSVGRIEERKNSLNLLRAARKLKVPIVFIGRPLRPESKYVKIFFKELNDYPGFAKNIPYLPPQSDILANAYASAHVHALVSSVETPGIASLEAGLNKANLVVGNCPPVLEYFQKHAWISNPKSILDIQKNLLAALNAPRNFHDQSNFIMSNFSWLKIGQMTKEIYGFSQAS